ncbi:MAG: type IX secretion system membrane protein PorP/SprF [Bacteroidales bacterium]|nr:type IX secretion system membrane protein PorP/SprF [Bacteroidales bacterium]
MSYMRTVSRYIMAVAAALFIAHSVRAQDQAVFNNYIANQGVLNPAYNGSRDVISAIGIFRSQWTGFEGAPFTGALNVHGQVDKMKDLGIGVVIMNDHSGFTNNLELFAAGSYKLRIDKRNEVRLGLQAGFKNVIYNANKAVTVDYGDPVFDGRISKFGFNFGFGALFMATKGQYFAGLSIPRFFSNDYDSDKQEIKNVVKFKNLHTYIYGGYVFDVDDYKIKPTALVRLVPGAPMEVDISCSMLFADKLWLGLSYRTVTDIVFFADYQINQSWGVSYSFDFPLNDIKKYTVAGSHEIGIHYDFQLKRRPGMRSIRYF